MTFKELKQVFQSGEHFLVFPDEETKIEDAIEIDMTDERFDDREVDYVSPGTCGGDPMILQLK